MRPYARVLPALLLLATIAVGCMGGDATTDPSSDPPSGGNPPRYTLTMSASGAGSGTTVAAPTDTSYALNTVVTITATADAGSAFTGWGGDGAGQGNPCSVTMSGNKTVTATFTTSTGVGQFDGIYDGTWTGTQSNGATLSGPFTLTINGGVIAGTFAPLSGSAASMSGTTNASGVITGTISDGGGGCAVDLAGQLTTATTGGITGATATGTYTLVASATCNTASGTWSATRR